MSHYTAWGKIVFKSTLVIYSGSDSKAAQKKQSNKTHCEKQYIKTLCRCNESVIQTIREIGMTQLQVLAGASGVALCAQWVLHLLNLQLEGVE